MPSLILKSGPIQRLFSNPTFLNSMILKPQAININEITKIFDCLEERAAIEHKKCSTSLSQKNQVKYFILNRMNTGKGNARLQKLFQQCASICSEAWRTAFQKCPINLLIFSTYLPHNSLVLLSDRFVEFLKTFQLRFGT